MDESPFPMRHGQVWHPMMAEPEHDDIARQHFVQAFMHTLNGPLAAGNTTVWENRTRHSFEKQNGRGPGHVSEIRKALLREPFTQVWSSMKRCAREMSYESVGPMVERQLPALIARARGYRDSNRKLGSLEMDPTLPIPRYLSEVENHAKPGGYHTELTEDDVFAGAEYDRTFHLTGSRPSLVAAAKDAATISQSRKTSGYGPLGDDMGAALIAWARANLPQLRPRRILDMGCTVGHSTLPWVDAFPDAEVHAIDVAAPVLRYAHARAEALGKKVHFSQQNAEATRFASESFDLVLSHLLVHELSVTSLNRVFAECHRLLKPGGVMMHLDIPPATSVDMLSQGFQLDWNTHYNAEPFITKLMEIDLAQVAQKQGFDPAAAFHAYAASPLPGSTTQHHFFAARKT